MCLQGLLLEEVLRGPMSGGPLLGVGYVRLASLRGIDLRGGSIRCRFLFEEGTIHIAKLRPRVVVSGALQFSWAVALESCCTLLREPSRIAALPFVFRGGHDGFQSLGSLSLHLVAKAVPRLGIPELILPNHHAVLAWMSLAQRLRLRYRAISLRKRLCDRKG